MFLFLSVQLSLGNELKLTTEDLSRTLDSTFVEFIPARSEFSVRDYNRRVRQGTYYWSMPRQFLGKKVRTSWKTKWTYFIFLSLFFLSLIIFIASMFLLELFFYFLLYTIINCSFPLSFSTHCPFLYFAMLPWKLFFIYIVSFQMSIMSIFSHLLSFLFIPFNTIFLWSFLHVYCSYAFFLMFTLIVLFHCSSNLPIVYFCYSLDNSIVRLSAVNQLWR